MNNLLELTINAHGGLDNWGTFKSITAKLHATGLTFERKQQTGLFENVLVTADTKKQSISFEPLNNEEWHSAYTPDRVAIETIKGDVVEELLHPRSSFIGHVRETPWTRLQAFYFASYAMWTYLNVPFIFANPGYAVQEIEPWEEDGKHFRRLQVIFPKDVATHGPTQTFYIGDDGLIHRHDYNVEIVINASSSHYLFDYKEVNGIKIPTRRLVYMRKEDNTPVRPEPVLISINLHDINLK